MLVTNEARAKVAANRNEKHAQYLVKRRKVTEDMVAKHDQVEGRVSRNLAAQAKEFAEFDFIKPPKGYLHYDENGLFRAWTANGTVLDEANLPEQQRDTLITEYTQLDGKKKQKTHKRFVNFFNFSLSQHDVVYFEL